MRDGPMLRGVGKMTHNFFYSISLNFPVLSPLVPSLLLETSQVLQCESAHNPWLTGGLCWGLSCFCWSAQLITTRSGCQFQKFSWAIPALMPFMFSLPLCADVFLSHLCHFNGALGEECVYAGHHVYINFHSAITPEVINLSTWVSLSQIWDNSVVTLPSATFLVKWPCLSFGVEWGEGEGWDLHVKSPYFQHRTGVGDEATHASIQSIRHCSWV